MTQYNGHRSRAYWNVSLWINNDEGLYVMAREYIRGARHHGGKRYAAAAMLEALKECGHYKTPDGYAYSADKIRAAMVGID
jgi:hypothetical protein